MAIDYANVLLDMGIDFTVVGRGNESAKNFEKSTKVPVFIGGIAKWVENFNEYPPSAIVAVGIEELFNVTCILLDHGFKSILLEKPGGFNLSEINKLSKKANVCNANILIAYNRRFYSSVLEAIRIIEEDGGVKSFFFEFTEWSHDIESLDKKLEIKKQWLLANSSHVIDLAFFLGGKPKTFQSYTVGELAWHPAGCIFTGAGITESNALFSYTANWDAPGRWSVEIMTKNKRLIFKPLEKLKIQNKRSIEIKNVKISNVLDIKFKPGLYRQVEAFINKKFKNFLDIHQQSANTEIYRKILNGNREEIIN